jgi:hypothetical protein
MYFFLYFLLVLEIGAYESEGWQLSLILILRKASGELRDNSYAKRYRYHHRHHIRSPVKGWKGETPGSEFEFEDER